MAATRAAGGSATGARGAGAETRGGGAGCTAAGEGRADGGAAATGGLAGGVGGSGGAAIAGGIPPAPNVGFTTIIPGTGAGAAADVLPPGPTATVATRRTPLLSIDPDVPSGPPEAADEPSEGTRLLSTRESVFANCLPPRSAGATFTGSRDARTTCPWLVATVVGPTNAL